ncbi:MAG: GHKL domain-containing protein [Acetatifactor sp.]|nr:GHKL domain-containing protein [Acetatifactor sp.]
MKNALLLFFCYAVEALIMWQYSTSLFIPKRSNKMKVSALTICYFTAFLLSIYNQLFVNLLSFLLINFIFLYTQYELTYALSLFHSAIITAIMAMSELAPYGIISLFFSHFLSDSSLFHDKILFAVLSKILYFLIMYIISHIFNHQKNSTTQQNKSAVLLGFIPLTSLFVMLTFMYTGEATIIPPTNNWMMALSAVFLLCMNLLAFGINQYDQQKNTAFTEMQVLLQKEYDSAEYYKMLLQQNENQNILIHDIKKHLQTIDLLNEKKDYDKIKAYIHQLLKSSDLKEFSRLCDHEMLNAILSRYKRQCSNLKIDFIADIRNGTTDFISDSDLTALFCNLLDNAVEAAEGIPGSYIELNTVRKKPTDYVVLSVINSCRNNPFMKGSHSLDTKKSDKKKHGFGIKSIQKAVVKYHGDIQMYYNEDALTFHTIITLIPPESSETTITFIP